MADGRKIETLLSSNSELHIKDIPELSVVPVTEQSKMRPDLVFGATANMKWAMVLNGIDSPYQLAPGRVLTVPDPDALENELLELEGVTL